MQINVIGGIFDTTGYSSHTRSLINALYKITDVKFSTQLIQGWEKQVNDAELDMITTKPKDDEINLIVSIPHNWRLYTTPGRNICYLIWEGDKIPKSWIKECINKDITKIIVASQHTKQAILNTIKDLSEEECKVIMEKLI